MMMEKPIRIILRCLFSFYGKYIELLVSIYPNNLMDNEENTVITIRKSLITWLGCILKD